MAFILIYLHGKRGAALSNQMRDGKSFAPGYAMRWWKERHLKAPYVDVEAFLTQRIEWRFKKGVPSVAKAEVRLGDCLPELRRMCREVNAGKRKRFDLVFTSPPYHGVTNYHYDQWLRRWMLGGPDRPAAVKGPWAKRFDDNEQYIGLLDNVFGSCRELLKRSGILYVRTDAREFTFDTTHNAVSKHFPSRRISVVKQPVKRRTQTALFGDLATKPGERDIIVR
jgi:DNA modification methylase